MSYNLIYFFQFLKLDLLTEFFSVVIQLNEKISTDPSKT